MQLPRNTHKHHYMPGFRNGNKRPAIKGHPPNMWVKQMESNRRWARMGTDKGLGWIFATPNWIGFPIPGYHAAFDGWLYPEISRYPYPSAPICGQNDFVLPMDCHSLRFIAVLPLASQPHFVSAEEAQLKAGR